jgi:hypothetical protein
MAYFRKDDLVAAAQHFGVDISPEDNREQVYVGIVEAGKSDADIKEFLESREEEPEATEDVVEVPAAPKPEKKAARGDKVVMRYVGSAPSYSFGKHTFKPHKPFRVVTEKEARVMERGNDVRRATEKEIKEFYGL